MNGNVVYMLPRLTKRQFVKKYLRRCCMPEYGIRQITDFVAKKKGEVSYTKLQFYIFMAIEKGIDDLSEMLEYIDLAIECEPIAPYELRCK